MTKVNVDETFKGLVRMMGKGKAPTKAAGGGGGGGAAQKTEAPEPKTSGDKGGGCKCVVS